MTVSKLSRPPEVGISVICAGDARKMGFAQGEAERSRIRHARVLLGELEAFRRSQPRWMHYWLYRRYAEVTARRFLLKALAGEAEVYRQRLDGIAAGAGVSRDCIYLLNALEPMLASVQGRTCTPLALGACSAVAIRGRRSSTGEPAIARNFDYLPLVQPLYMIRENRPASGFRSLVFTAAPLAGAVDGMNEHGLCITYNYAFPTDTAEPAPPISMLIEETLATCATVGAAAEQLLSRPRWGAGLLMMADAAGDIASLELSNSSGYLRRPADGDDVLFHSNRYASERMREQEIPPTALWTETAPAALQGRCVLQSSLLRDERFQMLLGATESFGPEELTRVMSDHGPTGAPSDDTICMHGSYWYTTACLQFFPQSRRIRVAYSSTCQATFTDITFERPQTVE